MLAGRRAAKRDGQMAASSEHEFEGRVSGELSYIRRAIRVTSRAYPGKSE